MKNQWTEEEVVGFPSGEHDYFERKSGLLFGQAEFRDKLAKALSALANSGGGQILLGVKDDGILDGVPKFVNKTLTRDHLEQIIPNLVDHSLSAFRVHEVIPAAATTIPTDRVVIVIDVGDSPHAPHQARHNKVYYYRPSGRSEPAPHFYLEALRNRAVKPVLIAQPLGVRSLHVNNHAEGVFLQIFLEFEVRNDGRNLAQHWFVDVQCKNEALVSSGTFRLTDFPKGSISSNRKHTMKEPLLPSTKDSTCSLFGLNIKPEGLTETAVQAALNALFNDQLEIVYLVVSENTRSDERILPPSSLCNWVSGRTVLWALRRSDNPKSLYAGYGLYCNNLRFENTEGSEYCDLFCTFRNLSAINYVDLRIALLFYDAENRVIHVEGISLERLAHGASKTHRASVPTRDLMGFQRVECNFMSDRTMNGNDFFSLSRRIPNAPETG